MDKEKKYIVKFSKRIDSLSEDICKKWGKIQCLAVEEGFLLW